MSKVNQNTQNTQNTFSDTITLAITGASGAAYALRLMECLVAANYKLYVLCSSAGRIVLDTEVGFKLPASPDAATKLLTEKFNANIVRKLQEGKP